jgi:hypothetical protein
MFERWLDTFIDEKGFDLNHTFEVEGPIWGTNLIPLETVIVAMKCTGWGEQQDIKAMLVKLDFINADCLGYFKHLAQALAI